MVISQLIKELQQYLKNIGDVPVLLQEGPPSLTKDNAVYLSAEPAPDSKTENAFEPETLVIRSWHH